MTKSAQPKKPASNHDCIADAELELLSQIFLFADLPQKRLFTALKNCQCLRLSGKKVVYRQGEAGEEMCIILSGLMKISTRSADGKEIIFDLLSKGDFFGELSLLDGEPRTATVTTLVPSVLIVLKRDCFIQLLEDNPTTSIRLLQLLAHRLRATDKFLEEVFFHDSETRLAKRVMVLEDIYGKATKKTTQAGLNVSQQEMANLIGITRERVNKLLKKWERAKIISLQHNHLTVLNPALLQKLASQSREKKYPKSVT